MRYGFIFYMFLFFFIVGIAFLFKMQIVEGDRYRSLSESNRIKVVRLPPLRGKVLDFKGIPLAINVPSFDVFLMREELTGSELDCVLKRISCYFSVGVDKLRKRLKKYSYLPPFVPIPLLKNVSKKKAIFVASNPELFPGVRVFPSSKRFYPQGAFFSHLVGYVGEASKRDILRKRYFPGDEVGKTGVERFYEDYLRGKDGSEEIEINSLGERIRVLRRIAPKPGYDIYLTVDLGVQKLMRKLFEGKAGAAILMDPRSGKIYGLYSSPSFDPNWFSKGISRELWKELLDDPKKPLLNRAIGCSYAPGSTFKITVALCALMKGVLHPRTKFTCPGFLVYGGRKYRCWRKSGHGRLNVVKAIEQSCDVFFYNVGLRLDVDAISRFARMLGYGEKTGIDLPGEKDGVVPSRRWKTERFGDRWYKGETLSLVIGQGYLSVTPIQQAVALSAVVNGGCVVVPHVLDRVVDGSGKVILEKSRVVRRVVKLSRQAVDLVKLGMLEVVEGDRGTGKAARLREFRIAGKTGTAQVIRIKDKSEGKVPYKFRDHAWFIAFAPYSKPRFVVVVIVEHGGHGGSVAAPIAKEILRYALYNL